ncbi:hypothetical protein Q4517_07175 [Tenacibaculum sp. 1_MG-2023]|uniref:hypothetical protein n=1 Tax=Tenacibaculum sp. 1_MG-2023 TaxID=3062653 RepID=UPI0026E21BEB|nr:hypothetical protein [Tenacibaculum sp. 1_MG-2023]MDO6675329.1 hypothetical protein [Tenacibaculum sp. 1_MG-2023]
MKDMQKVMRKVLNVNKVILFYFILFYLSSCSSVLNKRTKQINSSNYIIKSYKSKNGETLLKVNTFDKDFYSEPITPIVVLNNIHFLNNNLFNVGVGKHNVEIAFIGKITINIKDLVIKQGDSIVINAYLKQDPTPIVD